MWARMMAVCFATNGLSSFMLKVVASEQPSLAARCEYFGLWYASGLALCLVLARRRGLPRRHEIRIGSLMAVLGAGGMLCSLTALSLGLPGHIAFPAVAGGGLIIVTAASVIVFRERITIYGGLGLLCGMCAITLMSLPC